MNNIAYLTSFLVLNAHFKSFSVPSSHGYIECIVSLLSKRCFQTYLVLKGDPFLHSIKIGELKHTMTDPLMFIEYFTFINATWLSSHLLAHLLQMLLKLIQRRHRPYSVLVKSFWLRTFNRNTISKQHVFQSLIYPILQIKPIFKAIPNHS